MKITRKNFFVKKELLERSWTEKLINELLPKPILKKNSYGAKCMYFEKEVVLQAEKKQIFVDNYNKIQNRRLCKDKNVAILIDKINFMKEYFESITFFNDMELEQNIKLLCLHFHTMVLSQFKESFLKRVNNSASTSKMIKQNIEKLNTSECSNTTQTLEMVNILLDTIAMIIKCSAKNNNSLLESLSNSYITFVQKYATSELTSIKTKINDSNVSDFLSINLFPTQELLTSSLYQIYMSKYIPILVENDLKKALSTKPASNYPLARALKRKFIIHTGPTNSGKTYNGLNALEKANSGAYLGPLRLLALEVQETLLNKGVLCSLLTGEEEDIISNGTHISSTVEKANLSTLYDVVVIDECQMLNDKQRGSRWTRAILGIMAKTIHCCTAPEGLPILTKLISDCGDEYEIKRYERFSSLILNENVIYDISNLEEGDAIIAFSKRDVLTIADYLNQNGKPTSVIYGSLPYPARKMQMQQYLSGQTKYIVTTDAIGMGINLPVKRILFTNLQKFDGERKRILNTSEIKQIAGRAGRRGFSENGYVCIFPILDERVNEYSEIDFADETCFNYGVYFEKDVNGYLKNNYIKPLKKGLQENIEPIHIAYIDPPIAVLNSDYDILDVLKVWQNIDSPSKTYNKTDVSRWITMISLLRANDLKFNKEDELRCCRNIVFDENNEVLVSQFIKYCKLLNQNKEIPEPKLLKNRLQDLENSYKSIDLYYSFCKNFNQPIKEQWIVKEKAELSEKINVLLTAKIQKQRKSKKQKKHS